MPILFYSTFGDIISGVIYEGAKQEKRPEESMKILFC